MWANANRDTGHLASSGATARWITKPILPPRKLNKPPLYPFRYYYTIPHLERPPRLYRTRKKGNPCGLPLIALLVYYALKSNLSYHASPR